MAARVRVQEHAGVQDAVRVEQPLDPFHHRVGALAPLGPHERGHVAPGAVLGLDRPVVLVHHQLDEPLHEGPVAFDRLGAAHVLREHEVQVSVLGVAEDRGVGNAVAREQLLAVADRLRQPLDRDRDVLGQECRAARAQPAGAGCEPLAQVPERRPLGLAGGEARGLEQPAGLQDRLHVPDRGRERRLVPAAQLDEQRRVAAGDLEGQRVLRRDRAERGRVQDLERVGPGGRERRDGRARFPKLLEEDERGGAGRRLGHGPKRRLGHEAERPLRADHQVRQDLGGSLEIDEGVQAVAARVLGREFPADAAREPLVAADLVAQGGELRVQLRPRPPQRRVRVGLPGLDHDTVGEQHGHGVERVVAVLGDAATHAGRVVGEDAADHGRVDRGRVGPDPGAVRGEQAVQVAADDAGLAADAGPVVEHLGGTKERAELDQHVVGDRLARERGAGRAEGQVTAPPARPGEELAHLAEAAGTHDRLGDQTVDRGVGRATQAIDRARQHPFRREDPLEVAGDRGIGGSQPRCAQGRASPTGTRKR